MIFHSFSFFTFTGNFFSFRVISGRVQSGMVLFWLSAASVEEEEAFEEECAMWESGRFVFLVVVVKGKATRGNLASLRNSL